MRSWDQLTLKEKTARYRSKSRMVPKYWKPPTGETYLRIRFAEYSPEQQLRLIEANSVKVPKHLRAATHQPKNSEELDFLNLSIREQRRLWRMKDPRVPPGFLPKGVLPWKELAPSAKVGCFYSNDPRLPPNWKPPDVLCVDDGNYEEIPEELIGLDGAELLLAITRYLEREGIQSVTG